MIDSEADSFIDISAPLTNGLPRWPGSPGIARHVHLDISKGDEVNSSSIHIDAHAGTHIDAPAHHLARGSTAETIRLESMIGPAVVLDLTGESVITRKTLERLRMPPRSRILVRTDNSVNEWHRSAEFSSGFVGLDLSAAAYLAELGTTLIGCDYLSVQSLTATNDVHRVLLERGTTVLEGLNLRDVEPGAYWLVCLPLAVVGFEAAPARAILMKHNPGTSYDQGQG